MNVVWDSDTSTFSLTALLEDGSGVNLSGTSSRVIKIRNTDTDQVIQPPATDTNLAAGVVSATITTLGPGRYEAVLSLIDSNGNAVTYPSAEQNPPQFIVRADLDA